ncbi:MAG: hypothetical protein IJ464_07640 [Alistipes sp.]|nr:hypothetical protein [Alistipes sp.]
MRKFLVFAALVLGLAACQTEPEGLNVTMGGEIDAIVNVTIPEAKTRAGYTSSAQGAIANNALDGAATLRYIFQVFDDNGNASKAEPQVVYTDEESVAFPVRLVPEREYTFVVWADIATAENAGDNHYDTSAFPSITLKGDWKAMDETRDAYTGKFTEPNFTSADNITIELTRPFAKLRVVTTDIAELNNFNVTPHNAKVTYKSDMRVGFNALDGIAAGASLSNKTHTYDIASYGETGKERTIFADYFFAENDVVKFEMEVFENGGSKIVSRVFNTDINVRRNYLTTLKGNILTDGGDVNVDVNPDFGENNENQENYNVITSGAELINAINNGGSYMVGKDIYISTPAASTLAVTRATAIESNIYLNGKNIIVSNKTSEAFATVNAGNTLKFLGEGNVTLTSDSTAPFIKNDGSIILNGGTFKSDSTTNIISGDGDIFENGGQLEQPEVDHIKTALETLQYIFANGGEMTLTEDITAIETLTISTTNAVVINGDNKTIYSPARYGIEVTADNANITFNKVNLKVSTERISTNYICGIKMTTNNSKLTLNECTIDFEHESAHDWAYAVNQPAKQNNTITINGGTYEGANVINIWGKNHTINIDGTILTSLYQYNKMYRGVCVKINSESANPGTGNNITIMNTTFNGDYACATEDVGENNTWNIVNNTDNTKSAPIYNGEYYYYRNIEEALADGATNLYFIYDGEYTLPLGINAKSGDSVKLVGDVEGVVLLGTNNQWNNNALPGNYAEGMNLTLEKVTYKTINNGYSGGFGGTKSVTFKECEIIGQMYAHSNAPHYFYDCTIDPLNGYLYTYASDCVFERCHFRASEGKALQVYAEAPGTFTTTITDCTFKADKHAATWDGKPVTGIDVNSANGAKMVVSINNCKTEGFPVGLNSNTDLFNIKCADLSLVNLTVDGLIWKGNGLYMDENGNYTAVDMAGVKAAVAADIKEIALTAGEYTMLDSGLNGKTLTITGTEDTVIDASNIDARNQFVTGATIVFDGVTINFGKVNYMGFANTASLTYRNCHINGLQFLFGENVVFENCTFDSNGAEHSVWTYGCKNVSFTECDFTYGDRCVNCYSDNDVEGGQTVNFSKCTFTTENTASEGAVETNSCFITKGIAVTLDGCTAPAYGELVWVSRWDSTNGANTTITIK